MTDAATGGRVRLGFSSGVRETSAPAPSHARLPLNGILWGKVRPSGGTPPRGGGVNLPHRCGRRIPDFQVFHAFTPRPLLQAPLLRHMTALSNLLGACEKK